MSRLTELLTDLEKEFSQGNRLERELSRADVDTSDLIKNDPALLTGLVTAATLPYTGPSWLLNFVTRGDDITRAVSKMYGAVGKDMGKQVIKKKEPFLPETSRKINEYIKRQKNADEKMMFQQMKLRNEIKNRPPVGSGSRVGTDVAGRNPMPQTKPPLSVVRGPRAPINVDSSKQLPLPLRGGRNTGGVSETDKAMIDWMLPKTTGKYRVKEIDKVKWNKDQLPRKSDRILQRRPANAEEVGIIEDLAKKGFYDKSGSKGIMNSPPAKSQMEQVGAAKRTEQLANRQKFLEDAIRLNRSKIAANEAPSKDYNKLLEEYSRLIESLK